MDKFIDIEKVISDKNPRLIKWLPSFLVNYLKKILHEDEVNDFLTKQEGVEGIAFCDAVIDMFNIELTPHNLDNIPAEGGIVLAVNHPLGGMDAMALVTLLKHKREDIKFIVNDILMNLKNLKGMFIGVNKHGKNAKESLKKVDELFATEQLICLFPAGLVSRKNKGKVEDLEWKKTFITRCKKHNKTVIPVHINGEMSNFFYRLSNIRSKLGIKANIEMLYLVNEMYSQKDKKMKIVFGEPIKPETFNKSKTDLEWAAEVKKKVYALS